VRECLKKAAAVVAPSHYLVEGMSPYRGDIQMIPNAIDLTCYPFQLRKDVRPKLVWVRHFHRIYNPELAVRTLAIIRKKAPEAELVMVGGDHDGSMQTTKQLALRLGLEQAVTFTGAVQRAEVSSWLQKADIFLNTTNFDNTPVSVLEAMACGLCVVTTNVGGIPYLLKHEQDALLTAPEDEQALAAATMRFINDSGFSAEISRNARATAEGFDWAPILQQWRVLLGSLSQVS
jgi:glycosyltransferase involved in cell wall biosynthesis